jgi:hypothetical protein
MWLIKMRFNLNDDKPLVYPLLGLACALVMMSGLVFFSYQYNQQQALLLNTAQMQLQQARLKQTANVQDVALRKRYLPAYQELQAMGLIAQEQRSLWIERLQTIYQQHKLLGIDYRIEPQQKINGADLGQFSLVQSRMHLSMDLLHEGDFFSMVDDLPQHIPPFVLRECELSMPIEATINSELLKPNISARCSLDWLSLSETK